MLPIFFIAYLVILVISFKKFKKDLIINPIFWLYMSWGLTIGLYLTSGIDYQNKLTFRTGLYVLSILLCFIMFYYLGKKIVISSKPVNQNLKNLGHEKKIWIPLYFRLSVIGILLWSFDILRLNSFNFGFRIENFTISFIGVLGSIFYALALIVWLYDIAHRIRLDDKIPIRAFVAAIIYLTPSIITAGRQAILIFIISTFIVLVYSLGENNKYRYKKRIVFFILLAIIVVGSYLIIISNYRANVASKVALFEYMLNSRTAKSTIKFANRFGIFSEVVLEFLYYYSHELPMLDVLYNNFQGEIYGGETQFHYISRRLPIFLKLNNNPQVYLDNIYNSVGLYSHVWRTAIANFILDFGRAGAFPFTGLLGFLVGYSKRRFRQNNSSYRLVMQALVCVGIFFSIQFSPFAEINWAYPLYWLIMIPMIQQLLIRK